MKIISAQMTRFLFPKNKTYTEEGMARRVFSPVAPNHTYTPLKRPSYSVRVSLPPQERKGEEEESDK